MTFAIGLEAWRCLKDVLMPSSGLCHYQMKYFKFPLVTSSTRHVYKTTRKPPEDQYSRRLQLDLKQEDVLEDVFMLSSWLCHYQMKYFRGPLVTSSTRHVHKTTTRQPKASPHGVCKWTWIMKASWTCPDALFRVMIKLTNKVFKPLLDTSSTRHI